MKRKILSLVLALVLALSLAACGGTGAGDEQAVLSVNVGPEPASIDPAFNVSVDVSTLLIHGFEGLMKLDQQGVPQPGMAESYALSDDRLTYTFTLREGAKWSDGEPVTAGQFEYAWKRVVDPVTGAPYSYLFDVIKGYGDVTEGNAEPLSVVAQDDKTLVVTLNAPCPYFLELCAYPTFYPVREDAVATGEDWATKPDTYISNGPYKLVEWTHDAYMLYGQNEYYYDLEALGPDQIKFVLMEDDAAALAAFQSGELAFTDTVPIDEINSLKGTEEFNVIPTIGTFFISIQTQKAPFNDPRVREALSLAIDRNFICDQVSRAGEQPAAAFVPTGLTDATADEQFRSVGGDYYSIAAEDYQANCDKARVLLAEAGYPNGEGFPAFEYIMNEGTLNQQIGEALQSMWKEQLGINAAVAQQEFGVFIEALMTGGYDLARNGWNADYNDPISFLDIWVTGGGNNVAGWSNPEYDALIAAIKAESDPAARFEKIHQAESILMAEMPIIPVYFNTDVYLKDPALSGFYSSPLGFKYFMYATLDK